MNKETAEFVIYIINEISNHLAMPTAKVYRILQQAGCIREYMLPFYDVLHTMGTQALVEDMRLFCKSRGVTL